MAKISPRLITTAPAPSSPSGEQHFMDKQFPGTVPQSADYMQYSPNDRFLDPDNGIFDVGKPNKAAEKVKTFERMKNRFGYDIEQSIQKYDENVSIEDKNKNAHKHTKIRHFFDKKGNWQGSSSQYKTNKDAKKDEKGKIIVKETTGNFEALKKKIKKKEKYKMTKESINESHGSREWAMHQIMFPNSVGQGFSNKHTEHPLHNTICSHCFKYSHTTPISMLGQENSFYLHHTYANGPHKIGIDDQHTNRWESKTSDGSGSRVSGTGRESLDKHLSYKEKKYKLQPESVNESLARSTQKEFADSKGKMKQSDEIDKKSEKLDKVKAYIKAARNKKKD